MDEQEPDPPEHHDGRAAMLRTIAARYGLGTLVETGTATGEMLLKLAGDFDLLVSIELAVPYFQVARQRTAHLPHVRLLNGDSERLLPDVVEELTEPALFFLDGHYSGPGTGRGRADTPVRAELDIICSGDVPHVVVVDDARGFGVWRDYPPSGWVEGRASDWGYSFAVELDAFVLVADELLAT